MADKNILITGNGFDLALGYKTKYEHFMTIISAARKKSSENFLKYLSDEWGLINYDSSVASSFYNKVRSNMSHNFIIDYFLNYYLKTMSWADFETEIMHIGQLLESIITALNSENARIFEGYTIELPFEGDLKYYSNYLSFINDNEVFKIEIIGIGGNSSKTRFFFYITDSSINENCSSLRSKVLKFIETLPMLFYKKLLHFSELFDLYLQLESSRSVDIVKPRYNFTSIITYNYTHNHVFPDLYAFHVNGELSSKHDSKGIIFGIDPSSIFRTDAFNGVTKEIQRAARGIKMASISSICKDIQNLYIFGCSLTTSDKDSLKLAFNEVKKRALSSVIIFYKSSKNKNEDTLTKMILSSNLKSILNDDYAEIINKVEFRDSKDFFEEIIQ